MQMAMRRQRYIRKVRTAWVISDENGGYTQGSPWIERFYTLQSGIWHFLGFIQVPKCYT